MDFTASYGRGVVMDFTLGRIVVPRKKIAPFFSGTFCLAASPLIELLDSLK